ncbi:MAG: hybrid sensor histidine kinase/response regulator [Gemmatimonadaceae bacterium]
MEGAYVALRSGEFLEIVAASGRAEVLRGLYLPENASLGGEVLHSSRALVVNDVDADGRTYRPTQRAVQAQRMLLAPLLTADGAIGTLVVLNRLTPFDDGDARVLQRLADHVAVAIVNARLYEEVMESTREWTVAFDVIATGMLMLDARGRVQRCNASALALLGAEHARQVVGRPFAVVLLHEPSGEAAALLDVALRERTVARGTLRSRVRGRIFEIVASPHPHGGAVLTMDDVTTLHSLTERYRMVVETARDAIVITDPSRHIAFANPAAEQLFGRSGGVVGLAVGSLVPPEQRQAVADYQRAAMAGTAQSYETVVIGARGEQRIVAISTAPLRQLGDITGTIATLRDITVERGARDAIANSEARYRNLFEAAADGLCTMDLDGLITSVNPALRHALGRPASELIGAPMTELVEPEDRQVARQLLTEALGGEQVRGEVRFRDGKGGLRVGSIIASTITEEGRVTGALAMMRDVSDERILAAQLMQREKLAAIGQLVSGVAHELNNPLGGIMAFSQLLLAGNLQGDVREGAEVIHAEAQRAAKIVGNLLAFARQQEPMRSAVDLNAVVRTVAQLRRYSLRSQQVELVLDLDADLPRTWADENQLHQVVLNLVTNAEQAMQQRPQPRRLTLATSHTDRRLEVRVSDTGAGMDSVQLSRVFNPFFTTKGVGEGTGLGLSIAHGIIREHSGELTAESEPGVGTTFHMVLPLVSAPDDDDSIDDAIARAVNSVRAADGGPEIATPEAGTPSEAAPSGAAPAQRRVLVVDDEASIRAAMSRYLRRAGYMAEAVAGGRAALAALAVARFDAILLDLRMPDLAGDAVFERLQSSDPAQAARIVFVTGDLRSDRARAFLASTGQPSVGKPFTFEELQEALEQVIETTT